MSAISKECGTCAHWDDYGDEEDARPREGGCHRFPPQHTARLAEDEPMHAEWEFPCTGSHWWCGEWKGREEA